MGASRITVRVRTVYTADSIGVVDDKGDSIVVLLSGVQAPKYNNKEPGSSEAYGYFAREFLRKKLAGHRIQLEIIKELQASPRRVVANAFISGVYINEKVLLAGWGTVIDAYLGQYAKKYLSRLGTSLDISSLTDEDVINAMHLSEQQEHPKSLETRLVEAQLNAMFIKQSGMHSGDESLRSIPVMVDTTASQLITQYKGHELSGCVEYVKDADYFIIMIQLMSDPLTCVKLPCKSFGIITTNGSLSSCAPEAQEYAITFLSSKTVRLIPMLSDGNSLVCKMTVCTSGTEDKDYAHVLLAKGYARNVDWMLNSDSSITELYSTTEESAKSKCLGIWKNANQDIVDKEVSTRELKKDKKYVGTVIDIPSSDSIVIRLTDGSSLRAWFSSLLMPKCVLTKNTLEVEEAGFNLREYLRKNYLNCIVEAKLDYFRDPPEKKDNLSTRPYFSIYLQENNSNIALDLIKNTACRVIHHPVSETNRSRDYALLLETDTQCQSEKDHSSGTQTGKSMLKVIDYSSFAGNNKAQVQNFARDHNGCYQAVVESIISGNKLRVYMANKRGFLQMALVSVAGILVPSVKRHEAFSAEAMGYAKNILLMKDVKVTFTGSTDKHTNALYGRVSFTCPGGQEKDFGESLLENGLGELIKGKAASESGLPQSYIYKYTALENEAKKRRIGLFKFYIDHKESIITHPGSWTFPEKYEIHGLQILEDKTFIFRLKDSEGIVITKDLLSKAGTKAVREKSDIFAKQIIVYHDVDTDKYLRARVESLLLDTNDSDQCIDSPCIHLYLIDTGKDVFLKDTQGLYAPIPDELLIAKPTTELAKLALLQFSKKDVVEKKSIDQEFLEYAKRNIVGVDLICYSCGYDKDGILNVFLFAEDSGNIETDDPTELPIDVTDSITGKIISNGLAKLISDEDIPQNADMYYEALTSIEQEALHARRGLWK